MKSCTLCQRDLYVTIQMNSEDTISLYFALLCHFVTQKIEYTKDYTAVI